MVWPGVTAHSAEVLCPWHSGGLQLPLDLTPPFGHRSKPAHFQFLAEWLGAPAWSPFLSPGKEPLDLEAHLNMILMTQELSKFMIYMYAYKLICSIN